MIHIIRKKIVTKMKIHGNKDIDDKQIKVHLKNTIDELTRGFMDYITQ
ncbi:MAG: hypothetical protein ACTHKJ_09060 [Candidatus Nitrosocosmicus sp.]